MHALSRAASRRLRVAVCARGPLRHGRVAAVSSAAASEGAAPRRPKLAKRRLDDICVARFPEHSKSALQVRVRPLKAKGARAERYLPRLQSSLPVWCSATDLSGPTQRQRQRNAFIARAEAHKALLLCVHSHSLRRGRFSWMGNR